MPSSPDRAPEQTRTEGLYFVYMVRCRDGSLYTGYARDPKEREKVHNSGQGAKYTCSRRPVSLVYTEEFETIGEALSREHQLKGLPRKKKEALVAGDLKILAVP